MHSVSVKRVKKEWVYQNATANVRAATQSATPARKTCLSTFSAPGAAFAAAPAPPAAEVAEPTPAESVPLLRVTMPVGAEVEATESGPPVSERPGAELTTVPLESADVETAGLKDNVVAGADEADPEALSPYAGADPESVWPTIEPDPQETFCPL